MLGFPKGPPPFFGAVVLPRSAIIGRPRRSSGYPEADSAAFGADVRMPPGRLCATSGPSATAAGIAALRSQAVAARSGRAGRLHDLEIEATRVQARLWKVENQLDLPG